MSWATKAPAAIDALVAAVAASPDLVGVGLEDGPRVVANGANSVISIGFVDENQDIAVTGNSMHEGLAVSPTREAFVIRCAASVLNGAGDIAAARREAYRLVGVFGQIISANKTLGGLVLSTVITSASLHQDQTENGAMATVDFDVQCDAFSAS